MTPEQLAQILDELGRRLGPAGQHAFELAVRYQVTNSLVGAAFGLAFLGGGLYAGRKLLTREYSDSLDSDMGKVIGAVIAGCAFLGGLFIIGTSVTTLLNPEWSAIRDILGAVR